LEREITKGIKLFLKRILILGLKGRKMQTEEHDDLGKVAEFSTLIIYVRKKNKNN
jgi:hypothetical protein